MYFGVLAFLISCKSESETNITTDKMNLLFIAIEDWSADAVGCYGNTIVKTPYVDQLATKGIRFNRAYCQGPVCNPSRASITTGLRPDATQVYGNPDDMDQVIQGEVPFIADVLKTKGAFTATTGKLVHKWKHAQRWVNSYDEMEMEKPFATKNGEIIEMEPDAFENYKGITQYMHGIIPSIIPPVPSRDWIHVPNKTVDDRLEKLRKERDDKLAAGEEDNWVLRKPFQQLMAEQVGDIGFSEEHVEDGVVARLGVKMIGDFAKAKKQFFLTVGLYATHTPLLAPAKYVNMYNPDDMEVSKAPKDNDVNVPNIAIRRGMNYDIFNGMYPEYNPTIENQKRAIASYYACASYIDDQVGVLLNALKENKMDKNTIVILWADHGFHLGEHGCWSKFTLFEQATRVPLIVYVPGAKGNGNVSDEIVELVDLLPTMCDLWGIEKDKRFEGFSFAPLLEDPHKSWKSAAYTICPKPLNGRSVRTKRYKYAEYADDLTTFPNVKIEAVELYDLENDPYEQHNLAGLDAYKVQQESLKRMLYDGWKGALPKN